MYINNPNTSVQSSNITQFGSSALATGSGVGGAGIPRVTVSSDSTVTGTLVTIAPVTITNASNQDYTPNAACIETVISNTDASGEVYIRDQVATTGTAGILLRPKATVVLATKAALRITNNSGASVVVTINELRTP